jgi:hypothetical protein
MYFVTLTDDSLSNATGVTYSDTMQGGNSALSSGNPTIPAGSDVTLTVDTSNLTLNMYGYTLDLINQDIDTKMYYAKNKYTKYSDIIKGNCSLDDWGNGDSYNDAKTHFTKWATNMANVKNFGVDLNLSVTSQNKSFSNFNATIGSVDTSNATKAEDIADGVYVLAVKNGEVLTDNAEYKALIAQIAEDYFGDKTKTEAAEIVFNNSGVKEALLNAIESSSTTANRSGKATDASGNDVTEQFFDNSKNWYDEVVRTFVIRRFKYEGSKFTDIIANDKIDYDLGVTANSSNTQNANSDKANTAKWYLSIYFNNKTAYSYKDGDNTVYTINDFLGLSHSSNTGFYIPSDSSSKTDAIKKNSVLMSNMYVENADFNLPASSTSDFNR